MFDQAQNPNMGVPMMNGYNYQGMGAPVPKFSNPLSPEQIKKLQQKGEQFSLTITEDEWLRAICNHRNAEGTGDSLTYDPITGEARCTICGYKFRPIESDISPDQIKNDVERITDILQTIKLMYIDLPADAAKEYFQIIPLIEKIPRLFEFAAKDMTKHEAYNWQYNNRNMGAISMFNNLQSMLGGGMMNAPQQPQQFYGQPQAPYYATPSMGVPTGAVPPQGNAFGYPGASSMPNPAFGYAASNPGFAYTPNPQMATAPVAPTTTTPDAPTTTASDTTVTQKVEM